MTWRCETMLKVRQVKGRGSTTVPRPPNWGIFEKDSPCPLVLPPLLSFSVRPWSQVMDLVGEVVKE